MTISPEATTPATPRPATPRPHADPLKVLIVGAGVIGHEHARVATLCEDTVLAGIADIDLTAADRLADDVGASGAPRPATYASLDEALATGDFDQLSVCTPSGLHVAHATAGLAAGCHVLIEKPLDVTPERARELTEAADRGAARGLVTSIISQHRFDPSSVAVHRAIEAGRFGRVVSCVASVAWWRAQSYYDSGDWRGTWELDGGGALMNQGVHTVDLLLWFLGRPVEVFAHASLLAHERIAVEDTAVATVTFASGALAVLHATTAAHPGLTVRVQVHGDRGSAVIDNDHLTYFYAADAAAGGLGDHGNAGAENQAAAEVGEWASDNAGAGLDLVTSHLEQYRDFARVVREGGQPRVTVADASAALAVVRAVYVSQAVGAPVLMEDLIAGKYDDVDVAGGLGRRGR